MGCNLSSKRRIPPSGNAGATRWAATLRSEMVTLDKIPVTLDEKLPTLRASGVLPVADHAWQVPGIDITQARPLADLCCTHQRLSASVLWIGHFVIFVKGCYMPRNIRGHARQKLGQASQLVVGVVEPGITSVTISTQKPISCNRRMESKMACKRRPSCR